MADDARATRPTGPVVIGAERTGQRLDNFLLTHLKPLPRALVYRLVRSGQVRVNGGRVKPGYRLQESDRIRVPPNITAHTPTRSGSVRLGAQLLLRIIHEDDRLAVIDKPSGVAVHSGSGTGAGLIESLRAAAPAYHDIELVHRLDKGTSGCLLLAKDLVTLRALHAELRDGRLGKTYLALVSGCWRRPKRIARPLARQSSRGGRRQVVVSDDGKHADSLFEPLLHFPVATLMRVTLHTGRTHQIRVHAADAGHPLAGDRRYGDAQFNRDMRRHTGLGRLFLHAESVAVNVHGGVRCAAPLPAELAAVLEGLRGGACDELRSRGVRAKMPGFS